MNKRLPRKAWFSKRHVIWVLSPRTERRLTLACHCRFILYDHYLFLRRVVVFVVVLFFVFIFKVFFF